MGSAAIYHPQRVSDKGRTIYQNLSSAELIEEAVRRAEGRLTGSGALTVSTGARTGRSPGDKFFVDDPSIHDRIDWGKTNQPISREVFERLHRRALEFLDQRDIFIFDGFAGADPAHRLAIRVVNTRAWQNLFVRQLFIRPVPGSPRAEPDFTILHVPELMAKPATDGTPSETFILVNLPEKVILIGGTEYAGEMKKAIFSVMNYLMPGQGVLPMHCSANAGPTGDVAVFFGLSGTGKTTLSADPNRRLIGDDEHGWGPNGVFNFEGGCYAKCIRLSAEGEPQIWDSIRFGAVLENVVANPDTRIPDYDDDSLTENTRAAFPIEFIPHALPGGMGGHPRHIIMLTADAFGVLPPIARLTPVQAMYHFLSGYTAKLAGTETGLGSEPKPDFSTCSAAPFLPRPPQLYAAMLGKRLQEHGVQCWLVNTGWTGGPFGTGERVKLDWTRAMVNAVLAGQLSDAAFTTDPVFGVSVPLSCPGVPSEVLQPRRTWRSVEEYDASALRLAVRFHENFRKFKGVDPVIAAEGGPLAAWGSQAEPDPVVRRHG